MLPRAEAAAEAFHRPHGGVALEQVDGLALEAVGLVELLLDLVEHLQRHLPRLGGLDEQRVAVERSTRCTSLMRSRSGSSPSISRFTTSRLRVCTCDSTCPMVLRPRSSVDSIS